MTQPVIKTEGWKELAEVLGIFRTTMEQEASVPSVSLEMDSKGAIKPSVKIYNKNDPYQAMRDCVEIFDTLRNMYGLV